MLPWLPEILNVASKADFQCRALKHYKLFPMVEIFDLSNPQFTQGHLCDAHIRKQEYKVFNPNIFCFLSAYSSIEINFHIVPAWSNVHAWHAKPENVQMSKHGMRNLRM